MSSINLAYHFPPAIPVGETEDTTHIEMIYDDPFTLEFLTPDPAYAVSHEFTGNSFYHQFTIGQEFDMSGENDAGGDFFEICGYLSFKTYNYRLDLINNSGHIIIQKRREFAKLLEGEDDDTFYGRYYVAEIIVQDEDTSTGSDPIQYRVNDDRRATVYQPIDTTTTPNKWGEKGHEAYEGIVGLSDLWEGARSWFRDFPTLDQDKIDLYPNAVWAVTSQTIEGQHSRIEAGLARVNLADVEPYEGELNYTLAGVKSNIYLYHRRNQPTIYEDDDTLSYSGNNIYGSGSCTRSLEAPITVKKWKDDYGIYDQNNSAFDFIPWVATTNYAWPQTTGYGGVAKGMFMSGDGKRYKITLKSNLGGVVASVEVEGDVQGEYNLGTVASGGEYFVVLDKVEIWKNSNWVELDDPYSAIGTIPNGVTKILHFKKQRNGSRWGFLPYTPQDPEPSVPEDENYYAREVFKKSARI